MQARERRAIQRKKLEEHTMRARRVCGVDPTTAGAEKPRFIMKRCVPHGQNCDSITTKCLKKCHSATMHTSVCVVSCNQTDFPGHTRISLVCETTMCFRIRPLSGKSGVHTS